jgi:hypothetical protein
MNRLHAVVVTAMAVLLVAVLAWPVAAQDPRVPKEPNPGQPERCANAGLGLAVLSQDGAIADILPAADLKSRAGSSPTRGITLVIEAPAMIGACADFQGYWGGGAAGNATAQLALHEAPLSNVGTSLASDSLDETKTGPATLSKRLKALTKVEAPGTYQYVATYRVQVTPDGGQAVSEEVRVPFAVVFYVKPKPGAIEGTVYGSDGNPLAGARVSAQSNQPLERKPPLVGLPVERPVLLGAGMVPAEGPPAMIGTGAGDRGGAVTGPDGKYRLEVGPGEYRVTAQAAGHKPQWYDGKDNAREADLVAVVSEQTVSGIDFHLVAGGEAPKPPRDPAPPKDTGVIAGKVTDEAGAPLAGMTVMAMAPAGITPLGRIAEDDDRPGRNATKTDANGNYELTVAVGKWTVQASGEGYMPEWYDGQADPKNATVLEVAKDSRTENINFSLAKMPLATVSGHVAHADGSLVRGAVVKAMPRTADGKPGDTRVPAGYRPSAAVKEDGSYELLLPPGDWVVVAKGPALTSSTPPPMVWWNQKATFEEADLLVLADGDRREDINFQLP